MSDHPGKFKFSTPAVKSIVAICLLIVIVSLAVKNMNTVELGYYNYKFQSQSVQYPLLVVIAISLAVGFAFAWSIGFFKQIKLKSTIRKQDKSLESLREEIEKLKSPAPQKPEA